jgi:hypothetical protein
MTRVDERLYDEAVIIIDEFPTDMDDLLDLGIQRPQWNSPQSRKTLST